MKKFTATDLRTLVTQQRLAKSDFVRALRLLELMPKPADWRLFIERLCLALSILFIGDGVILFVAANWQAMNRIHQFAILEGLILATTIATLRLKNMMFKSMLCLLSLLWGALFAFIGQTYQTGADPYELFLIWSVAIIPYVVVAAFAPLWLFCLFLLNITIALYFHGLDQLFFIQTWDGMLLLHFVLNALALIACDLATSKKLIHHQYPLRLIAFACCGFITTLALKEIMIKDIQYTYIFGYMSYILLIILFYRVWRINLFILSLNSLSAIVVSSIFMAQRWLHDSPKGIFFFVALYVIFTASMAASWIKRLYEQEATHE